MKRKIVFLMVIALCFPALTGCECSHEWVQADCVTPKTCSKCGATEGEAPGHAWSEASCTVPRTCSVCGLTQGDALEHSWVEANYQAPKTCSVCHAAQGEALPSAFDELGLHFNVEELNVPYPLTIAGAEYTYTVNSYEIYASDDSHEAREGFEWRTVTYTAECLKGDPPSYALPIYPDFNNCYDMESFNRSLQEVESGHCTGMSFCVNYNGIDYSDCLALFEDYLLDYTEEGWLLQETLSFLVPTGFDGMFICLGGDLIASDYYTEYMNLYMDENTKFFRLK